MRHCLSTDPHVFCSRLAGASNVSVCLYSNITGSVSLIVPIFFVPSGMTALHVAVRSGRKDITLCLLEHGADVNAVVQCPLMSYFLDLVLFILLVLITQY